MYSLVQAAFNACLLILHSDVYKGGVGGCGVWGVRMGECVWCVGFV